MLACLKAISTMIRDCEFFELDDEHLQILLHYVERNLHDSNRQASALYLFKAIFSRTFSSITKWNNSVFKRKWSY